MVYLYIPGVLSSNPFGNELVLSIEHAYIEWAIAQTNGKHVAFDRIPQYLSGHAIEAEWIQEYQISLKKSNRSLNKISIRMYCVNVKHLHLTRTIARSRDRQTLFHLHCNSPPEYFPYNSSWEFWEYPAMRIYFEAYTFHPWNIKLQISTREMSRKCW